jgi:hypothetical protein
MWVKTIGHGWGGHPCGPNPYLSWLRSIKSLKLVKLLQVWKKSDSGECIGHASVTPMNTEYTKYDPPGVQVSDDALAQKHLSYTPPSRLKRKI